MDLNHFSPYLFGALSTQDRRKVGGGPLPPRHHYKLLPNKNNLCADQRDPRPLSSWWGRRAREAEGGICVRGWQNLFFFSFFLHRSDKHRAWNLKRQRWRGSVGSSHSLLNPPHPPLLFPDCICSASFRGHPVRRRHRGWWVKGGAMGFGGTRVLAGFGCNWSQIPSQKQRKKCL